MMFCNTFYPLTADVYYATQSQNDFGEIDKSWEFNQTINIDVIESDSGEQIKPDQMLSMKDTLVGRIPVDIRKSDISDLYSLTDILITNINNGGGQNVYYETAGVRKDESTLFEIASLSPHNGPFGKIDYYVITLKRSQVQELID